MKTSKLNKVVACIIGALGVIFLLVLMSTLASVAKAGSPKSAHPAYITVTAGTPPNPLITLAYHKIVTSSQQCTPEEGPEKAVNGTWLNSRSTAYWYGDNWCSAVDNKWIQVDLGREYYIAGITLRHAGDGLPFTTRDFVIYGKRAVNVGINPYYTIATVLNNTSEMTYNSPTGGLIPTRYIKVVVRVGAQSGQPNVARIYEILVDGYPVP